MQKTGTEPRIKFITDATIVLECLYDVYVQEEAQLRAGKDLRKTMLYPFLKMLEREPDYAGKIKIQRLHQTLWIKYQKTLSPKEFIRQAKAYLEAL